MVEKFSEVKFCVKTFLLQLNLLMMGYRIDILQRRELLSFAEKRVYHKGTKSLSIEMQIHFAFVTSWLN